ncbi:MAG TPA: FtsX-like permease family protein [Opitutaceae bacterium]|nr:FtsX-like permease family protein [Opitutaceae bacterium]
MAWRDSRASRRRLALFSLSIAAGIAALVALGSGSASLARSIRIQAKGLLGADLAVSSRAPLGEPVRQAVAALGGEDARDESFSSMMAFPGAGGAAKLVQVRAMEGGYPFYGDFVTEPAAAPARLRSGGQVVIVEQTLLDQFGVHVGDTVRLGRSSFVIAGALLKLPGESAAVATLAPRALIPLGTLAATGLAGPGSLVRHRIFARLPPGTDADALAETLRARFPGERLGIDTAAGRERELGQVMDNIHGFLSLVGFIALFLGGIGVASAIHVHVSRKLPTVATLRCLGASAGQGFAIYLVQGLGLGIVGSVLGAGAGVALQGILPRALRDWLPFPVDFQVSWAAVGRGLGAGLAICVLFSLLPLLEVRRVSPLAALRASFAPPEGSGRRDPWRLAIVILLALAVALFAWAQTHSRRWGVGFAGVLGVGCLVLGGLARGVSFAARRWPPRGLPYVLRQAVANLHRPQNRTVLLVGSLGLGTFLLVTLWLARATLLHEVADSGGGARPNLLFFDVQDDQIGPLEALAAREGMPILEQAPVVTMRIASLRGRSADQLLAEPGNRIPGWTLRREYRSTYRGALAGTERVVAGHFADRAPAEGAPVPISVEEGLFHDLRLRLGDEIDWNVQGVPMRSKVASVRAVEWRRLEPNFFVVFPPGVLEAAPKFHLAAVRAATPADSARLQRVVAAALPSVTALDLATLQELLDRIFAQAAFVLNFMAAFAVATGLAVLAGAVAASRYQRRRDTALLRTLGASRGQVAAIDLAEHAVLGLLAAAVGAALGLGASALLARFLFEAPAVVPWPVLPAALAGVTAATMLTGWLADRGAAARAPLELLREEER